MNRIPPGIIIQNMNVSMAKTPAIIRKIFRVPEATSCISGHIRNTKIKAKPTNPKIHIIVVAQKKNPVGTIFIPVMSKNTPVAKANTTVRIPHTSLNRSVNFIVTSQLIAVLYKL